MKRSRSAAQTTGLIDEVVEAGGGGVARTDEVRTRREVKVGYVVKRPATPIIGVESMR